MHGFYRSSYIDQDGNKHHMTTTQFEPNDACKAFPCWDEPAAKATFDIVLKVPTGLVALSNMNVIDECPLDGTQLKEVKFATTPVMSTYLLAFIVGDLDFIESHTFGKINSTPIKCRVYTPLSTAYQGQYALSVCTRILDLFEEVLGIPYPLPKMDMVAIPDFDSSAMENWGLVTFSISSLLFNEQTSSMMTKQGLLQIWHMNLLINSLAILLPWNGGLISGLVNGLLHGLATMPLTSCFQNGIFGPHL
ncbi:hypothetical protein DSO57_1009260 [Entomophthora muscae]|uniref:Uncharacterized protein n=1 Tax=Entomophthora muscae TaxID=34485 RepID=A0ACC2UGJ8_9FUNG|nr:hypothetical protein DSO57_1009260 [Entomophthora muscae]